LKAFISIVILIPFIEELIFRYFLRYERLRIWRISLYQWNKIFPILVYIFVICFGLIHITNFSNNSKWFYVLSPLIVISQLLSGIIITYIRVRLNFMSGVFYHWIWNFTFVIAIPEIDALLNTIWTLIKLLLTLHSLNAFFCPCRDYAGKA
jgi:membrane protease YdiL (CAAX protease family)